MAANGGLFARRHFLQRPIFCWSFCIRPVFSGHLTKYSRFQRARTRDRFDSTECWPYPDDYFETVEQAKQESDRGYKPPLKANVADIASYVTVFLGFPIWGMTAPPVVRSFLAAHNLSGKTVIPLVTHGGYGLGDSSAVVAKYAPQALLVEGFSMQAPQERQTVTRVMEWLGAFKPTE